MNTKVVSSSRKKFPILYIEKDECCGCSACYAICPKDAIFMAVDEEGFKYPKINTQKCINCGLCIKVCPFKKKV